MSCHMTLPDLTWCKRVQIDLSKTIRVAHSKSKCSVHSVVFTVTKCSHGSLVVCDEHWIQTAWSRAQGTAGAQWKLHYSPKPRKARPENSTDELMMNPLSNVSDIIYVTVGSRNQWFRGVTSEYAPSGSADPHKVSWVRGITAVSSRTLKRLFSGSAKSLKSCESSRTT